MKKSLFIIFAFLLCSCQPRIKNDARTFEKVFSMTNFDIEVQNEGCFGGSTELFNVVKKKNGFYYLKSEKTQKGHLVSGIKMDSLKNFLKTRIGKNEYGGCTVRQYIRIGSIFNSVDYENSFCSGMEATIINDLLNYYNLISDVNTSE